MKVSKKDFAESLEFLHKHLKPGDTVNTIVRHVSRSGMSRSISCIIAIDGSPVDISYHVSTVVGEPIDKNHGGVKIGGCGMDMGFQLVYLLGSYLWPNGTPQPHGQRNGKPDSNGGYALKQRWI